jgi:DNA polymerase-3 subunit beta
MKKLIINADAFRNALKRLSRAVSANPTLPVLSNILLRAKAGTVELTATDLQLTISCSLPCECKDEIEVLIPYAILAKLTPLLGIQPLTIQVGKATATITADGEVYKLGGLEVVENFPKLPDIPKKNSLELDEVFMDWLHRGMATVSKDELRPAMTQALLEIRKGEVTVVSTDAHCLFRRKLAVPYDGVEEDVLIDPRVAKALEGFEKVTMTWRSNHLALVSGPIAVISTRVDAKFPDYKVVIPNSKPTLTVLRQDLLGSLFKSTLFNDRQVILEFKKDQPGRFNVHTEDVDYSRGSDISVIGAYSGSPCQVAFAPVLFETILNQIPFDEIRLNIDGPTRGVVITSEEEPAYLGLIMPLLLNN